MMCKECGFFIRFQSDHDAKCSTRCSVVPYAWAIVDDPHMMSIQDEAFLAHYMTTYKDYIHDNRGTKSGADSVLPAAPDPDRDRRSPDADDDDEGCPAGYGV